MSARREFGPGAAFVRALLAHARAAGCDARPDEPRSRPWSSAIFDGERVRLIVSVAPGPLSDAWAASLPEADLPVRGHYVADLSVAPFEGGLAIEALLIRDA